jgi:ribosomal protein S18 acetylase RimI-like enzyme
MTGPSSMRELGSPDLAAAALVLARGMCSNPIDARAFGGDPARRVGALARFFRPVLRGLRRRGSIVGAFRDGALVGVCAAAPPGRCQPALMEKLTIAPATLSRLGLGTPIRIARWTADWGRRDPREPHWHLGPVAVDTALQRRGIGSELLAGFCARLDELRAGAYLETDKLENVRFYEGFGFEVCGRAEVIGVPCWFMRRPAG